MMENSFPAFLILLLRRVLSENLLFLFPDSLSVFHDFAAVEKVQVLDKRKKRNVNRDVNNRCINEMEYL